MLQMGVFTLIPTLLPNTPRTLMRDLSRGLLATKKRQMKEKVLLLKILYLIFRLSEPRRIRKA